MKLCGLGQMEVKLERVRGVNRSAALAVRRPPHDREMNGASIYVAEIVTEDDRRRATLSWAQPTTDLGAFS